MARMASRKPDTISGVTAGSRGGGREAGGTDEVLVPAAASAEGDLLPAGAKGLGDLDRTRDLGEERGVRQEEDPYRTSRRDLGKVLPMSREVNPMLGAEPPVQLFRVVLTLATHLRTRMDQQLAEVGLTTAQAGVLTFVTGSDHAPTLGDAARSLGTSHQNVRQVVAALERKGMIEVLPDPADARVRRLAVTPRVSEVFADRDLADHHEVALWLSTLTEDEQRQAVGLLHRVLRSLVDEPAPRRVTPSRTVQDQWP